MGKISVELTLHQHRAFNSQDDDQIKEFLVELGLTGEFVINLEGENFQVSTELDHETHFIFVTLATGYKDPKENGYILFAAAKSQYSLERFLGDCQNIVKPGGQNANRNN